MSRFWNERLLWALLTENKMTGQSDGHIPFPYGLYVEKMPKRGKKKLHWFPPLSGDFKTYLVYKYEPGVKSFLCFLKNRGKRSVTREVKITSEIAVSIAECHQKKPKQMRRGRLNRAYDTFLNQVLEFSAGFILPSDPFDLDALRQSEKVFSMLVCITKRWLHRGDRFRMLHGDFQWKNVLLGRKNAIKLIDWSRFPWGDPGFDIGWWIGEYVYAHFQTGEKRYRDNALLFLRTYENVTRDTEIHEALLMGLLSKALVKVRFNNSDTGLPPRKLRSFLRFTEATYKRDTFIW
ncbi:MAG: hypothetical protein NUV54_02010 [Candidatus Taylorbacteria bacterium]|nr:hypothetical protein [Candidatus Taylorbacteria bacterium]